MRIGHSRRSEGGATRSALPTHRAPSFPRCPADPVHTVGVLRSTGIDTYAEGSSARAALEASLRASTSCAADGEPPCHLTLVFTGASVRGQTLPHTVQNPHPVAQPSLGTLL